MQTNADDAVTVEWANSPGFHEMRTIAVGCPVMITKNVDIRNGAVNGAFGTVAKFEKNGQNEVNRIIVRLDCGSEIGLNRTVYERLYVHGKAYYKSTFPLMRAFAITGH
jgi:hypothetical protein